MTVCHQNKSLIKIEPLNDFRGAILTPQIVTQFTGSDKNQRQMSKDYLF